MSTTHTTPNHSRHLDDLQHHLMHSRRRGGYGPVPPVACTDGFTISVQANERAYCTPRSNTGPWLSVEIGFPNRIEPLLWPYAESPGNWTDTVYSYVPIDLTAAVIELHGGFLDPT